MQNSLRFLMAQINPTVGAIEANAAKIIEIIKDNQSTHDLIIFPELALTGYPPEDLLLRDDFFIHVATALKTITSATQQTHVILGHPSLINNKRYNSASILHNHQCIDLYHKQHLPNYGVFDEKRYFTPGPAAPCLFELNGYRIGINICEDIWQTDPVTQTILAGADLLVTINASPFEHDKYQQREALLKNHSITAIYVNLIGGQDDLVFDGQSFVLDNTGHVVARAAAFSEQLLTVNMQNQHIHADIAPLLNRDALIYQALVCGLHDYVEKNEFPGVLLGLSGGIDSALTLAIAVDALGAERVHAVMMPSRYTADISLEDAMQQLNTLNVTHTTLSIEPAFNVLLDTLTPAFAGCPSDITEENMQARIRGLLLMALSNKTGKMVLTTSNKSESAVGYATLYGDMCGGFGVLSDVLKTQVYALANYRNKISFVIPERVITRPPSAELAPNQTDQDTLPDYPTLDAIIHLYVEKGLNSTTIIEQGYSNDTVQRVIHLIKRNEYKRRQAAPGVKISHCSFNKRDWRYPITSKSFESAKKYCAT